MIPPDDLLNRWEKELETLRKHEVGGAAATMACCIRELREWWNERELDELSYDEAADYSGLSSETVRKRMARGEIQNVGRKGSPRCLRRDLPTKPVKQTRNAEAVEIESLIARRTS